MFFVTRGGREAVRAEADELPGPHAALRLAAAVATATCRSATPRPSTLHRDEPPGTPARAARASRHFTPGRRPHLLHGRPDRGRDLRAASTTPPSSTTSSALDRARSSSRRGPTTSSAPTRSGTSPRARCGAALERRGIATASTRATARSTGRRSTSTWTDVARPLVADGDDPARRAACRSGSACTYMGADNQRAHAVRHPSRAASARSSASSGSCIEHYGGAFPFWLAPVQVRVLPVGEAHLEAAAGHRREALPSTATGPRWRSRPRRSASGSGPPSSRRSRSRSSTATGRASESLAVRERGGEPVPGSSPGIPRRGLLRLTPEKQGRTRSSPPGPTMMALAGVQPSRNFDEETGRCMQRLFMLRQRNEEE